MINTHQIARIALIALLIIGCLFVLHPFMPALLFAAVFCVFTWPAYHWLWVKLGRRDNLAAITITLILSVAVILPMAFLVTHLAESSAVLLDEAQVALKNLQPRVPEWVKNLPWIGDQLAASINRAAVSHEEMVKVLGRYAEPIRKLILGIVQMMMGGFLQLLMVAFIAFFFYRDGTSLAKGVALMVHRLGGSLGEEMLTLACNTVKGVMLGIFGTAVAQSAVALFGFWLAGAPMPILLALATFFLSIIPIGPPLVWGGAAIWLYNHGDHGWAIFLAVYGLLAISTVDNVIKPILISHSSRLPLLLVVLGVLGGAFAFGFIGIFLGPTLLAVGLTLVAHWIAMQDAENR